MEEYDFFKFEIIEEIEKFNQIKYIEQQIQIAEAVRIANLGKKNDYISWLTSKKRAIWKITKTEEEKEKEAMKNWNYLFNNRNKFLNKKKKTKIKKVV